MANLKITTTDLPDARARFEIEVAPDDIAEKVRLAAVRIGQDIKVPGFRKGKVPPQIVIRQLGREAVLEEALNDSLGEWYGEALTQTDHVPVGTPKLESVSTPEEDEPLTFALDVPVRPLAELGEYKGVEAGKRPGEVKPEQIDEEIEGMRTRFAKLELVDRAAQSGDYVVIDFLGKVDGEPFEGGESTDYLLELGSSRFIEGFEEQLVGAVAGAASTVTVKFPDDYQGELVAGKDAVFDVTVKEVKERRLPEIDDEFAGEVAGIDTIAELRADIESKLLERAEAEAESEFRSNVLDAVANNAKIDVPKGHIHGRAHEMWHNMAHSLASRGLDPAQYLQLTGKTEEELATDAEPEAEKSLRREAAVAAVVKAEKIEPTEADLLDALVEPAQQEDMSPAELLDRLREMGRESELRTDVATQQAVDLLVEHAKPIDIELAQTRDQMWTPEKESAEHEREAGKSSGEIWTPGS